VAQSVYSTQFIVYGDGGGTEAFEVPTGFTAVIRQMSWTVQASASLFSVNISDSEAAPEIAIDIRTISAFYETQHQEGRWVVPEGGFISLYVETIGSDAVVYIGGYLLRNS
jgi:hypothetical protein